MSKPISFSDKIFREYDVRGVYSKDYGPEFAELLATAVSQYLQKQTSKKPNELTFAVGRDARLSGDELQPRFISALTKTGINVINLNIVPTPLVYYSLFNLNVDGAVSITGSHNAAEYNGFKICIGKTTLHGEQIQELKTMCKTLLSSSLAAFPTPGTIKAVDIIEPYLKEISSNVKISKPLKIVIDSGNGAASVVAPKLFEKLGCKVIPLFCELDGTFPNHHPDPTVLDNIKDLQKAVVQHHADLGIAYDGDADRIGVVDEKGRPVFGDELMILYSREILSRKPNSKILFEVKCSTKLAQDIKKHGGIPIMWKTGHSLIKAKMKEEKAELAGEMSGHMFFQDRYYGYDDAVYASARTLELFANSSAHKFSDLLSDLPASVSTPELRVDCDDEIKFKVVENVARVLAKQFKTITIDGIRIETDDGWGLLRASNTQPAVVMRFEASSQKRLQEIKTLVESALENAKTELARG